jgi:hypothetical protein
VKIVEPIMLETDAGDEPMAPKFRMPAVFGGSTQFCAFATGPADSKNSSATQAMPTPRPMAHAAPAGIVDTTDD